MYCSCSIGIDRCDHFDYGAQEYKLYLLIILIYFKLLDVLFLCIILHIKYQLIVLEVRKF
jgi:hypothetical protein